MIKLLKTPRVNPEELSKKAEESLEHTRSQQPRVNFLSSYLQARRHQNGFGEDFEITLVPRGTT